MDRQAKISTGPNDKPRNDTIAESGPGVPDDSGRVIELDDEQIKRAKDSLRDRPDDKRGAP